MDIDKLIDDLNKVINVPVMNEAQERILITAVLQLLLTLIVRKLS